MKVILSMAMSMNGIIARENNSEDFLSGTWKYFAELVNDVGCLIWGRKSYKLFMEYAKKHLGSIKNVKKIVVSSSPNFDVGKNCELAVSPKEALNKLEKEKYRKVVLSGGATLNSSFAKLGLIDEIVLTIDSVIVGKGIPIFKSEDFDLELELIGLKKLDRKLIQLHYKVIK